MSDFLTLQGAKDLNVDAIHIGAVANSVDPVTGAPIDTHANRVGGVDYTFAGLLKKAGFMPAAFDFDSGGTLGATDRNLVVYYPADGYWYAWGGTLPKTIPPLSSPGSNGGIDVSVVPLSL